MMKASNGRHLVKRAGCTLALLGFALSSCDADSSLGNKSKKTVRTNLAGHGGNNEKAWGQMHQYGLQDGQTRSRHTGKITILTRTSISVATTVAPALRGILRADKQVERAFGWQVFHACVSALRKARRATSIFTLPNMAADDGVNIIVQWKIDGTHIDAPYRITLYASQGSAKWIGIIQRQYFVRVEGNVPISPKNTLLDGRPYWDPRRDTEALSSRLCDYLVSGGGDANEGG